MIIPQRDTWKPSQTWRWVHNQNRPAQLHFRLNTLLYLKLHFIYTYRVVGFFWIRFLLSLLFVFHPLQELLQANTVLWSFYQPLLPFTPNCIIQKPPQFSLDVRDWVWDRVMEIHRSSQFFYSVWTLWLVYTQWEARPPGSIWTPQKNPTCISGRGESLISFLLICARPETTDCLLSCRPFTHNIICSWRKFSQSFLVPHLWVSVLSLSTSLLSPSNQESQITYQRAVNHCLAFVAHVQLDETQRVCGNCLLPWWQENVALIIVGFWLPCEVGVLEMNNSVHLQSNGTKWQWARCSLATEVLASQFSYADIFLFLRPVPEFQSPGYSILLFCQWWKKVLAVTLRLTLHGLGSNFK